MIDQDSLADFLLFGRIVQLSCVVVECVVHDDLGRFGSHTNHVSEEILPIS